MFAELEAVCVPGTQTVRGRDRRKDFCLCPKNPGWEMSFIGFQTGNDDQVCTAKKLSLEAGGLGRGSCCCPGGRGLSRLRALRAPSLGTSG